MTAVHFTRCHDQYTVRFTFNRDVVELIKACVPGFARSWDPARKEWSVDAYCAAELAAVLRSAGHTVTGLTEPRRCDPDPADWAHQLFRRVGPGRAAPVFRALSKCLHPDVGGSTELQRELNDGYHELSTRRESA